MSKITPTERVERVARELRILHDASSDGALQETLARLEEELELAVLALVWCRRPPPPVSENDVAPAEILRADIKQGYGE